MALIVRELRGPWGGSSVTVAPARGPATGLCWAGHPARIDDVNPEDLQKLVTCTMPFGRYQGCVLADLPGPYLNWFAREGLPRSEIGRLLLLMHEIDHNGLSGLLEPLRRAR